VLLLDKYRYIKVTDVNGNIADTAIVTVEDKIAEYLQNYHCSA
jgi:hypothetical protein